MAGAEQAPFRETALRRTPRVGLIVWVLLAAAPVIRAAEVVVVRSSDAEPYTQAEAGVREILAEKRHGVRGVLLKEVADKGVATIGKPEVVVAVGTAAARWLQKQLPAGTKLVYCMVPNPGEAGLLTGRASRGVTTEVAIADQMKLVAEALPAARVVGMLYRSDTADGPAALQTLRAAVPPGWRVEAVAVNDHPSVAAAIDALTQQSVDVVWTTAEQKLYDTAAVRALLLAALRHKIPVWGFSAAFVRAGALLGVGVEPRAQGTQAADVVAAWLASPEGGREPAQPPRDFQVAVNLIVATQLGIGIPDSLVRRATFVFRPEK